MNRPFKLLLAAALALVATSAMADVVSVDMGCTNKAVANATTTANMGNAVLVDRQDNVTILARFVGDQAGTGNQTFTFARSYDGTTNTLETTPRLTMVAALNGATYVVACTNFNASVIGAAKYLHLISIANADGSAAATNITVSVLRKTVKAAP
jgi:hypothetical protein